MNIRQQLQEFLFWGDKFDSSKVNYEKVFSSNPKEYDNMYLTAKKAVDQGVAIDAETVTNGQARALIKFIDDQNKVYYKNKENTRVTIVALSHKEWNIDKVFALIFLDYIKEYLIRGVVCVTKELKSSVKNSMSFPASGSDTKGKISNIPEIKK